MSSMKAGKRVTRKFKEFDYSQTSRPNWGGFFVREGGTSKKVKTRESKRAQDKVKQKNGEKKKPNGESVQRAIKKTRRTINERLRFTLI